MSVQKIRWPRVYESSEEELINLLSARKLRSTRIAADAGDESVEQLPKKGLTIWCAEGSVTVNAMSNRFNLQPGDALRIDAQTAYSLQPGIAGYVYYQTN